MKASMVGSTSHGEDLLVPTDRGLYCAPADVWIDPWRPVPRAVVTHAHSDHARPGCGAYLAAAIGLPVLRSRLGTDASIQGVAWGEEIRIGDVRISLHPAGHVLGSAQVRVEAAGTPAGAGTPSRGETWVVTGDYKRAADPSCEPFELVPCHTLITESTFGLPVYRWPDPAREVREVLRWWERNLHEDRTSVLFAYSLGKAQRVLAALAEVGPLPGPLLVHGAVERMNRAYAASGVPLPAARHADADAARETRGTALVVAPPSAGGSTWIRKFGDVSTAFASGWMRLRGTRRRRAADRGFVLSDHVDWPALLATVEESGAERVGVTHGYTAPTVRYLRERGWDAFVVPTRYRGEEGSAEDADGDPPGEGEGAGRGGGGRDDGEGS